MFLSPFRFFFLSFLLVGGVWGKFFPPLLMKGMGKEEIGLMQEGRGWE